MTRKHKMGRGRAAATGSAAPSLLRNAGLSKKPGERSRDEVAPFRKNLGAFITYVVIYLIKRWILALAGRDEIGISTTAQVTCHIYVSVFENSKARVTVNGLAAHVARIGPFHPCEAIVIVFGFVCLPA